MQKRSASKPSGAVTSYTHTDGKIGVLLEVTCNSDFVARSDEFRALIHELALQIAATSPKFIRKEDVPVEVAKQYEISDPYFSEVCLYEQPFIKDNSVTVSQLIVGYSAQLRENIRVIRFALFKFGDPDTTVASAVAPDEDGQQPSGGGHT